MLASSGCPGSRLRYLPADRRASTQPAMPAVTIDNKENNMKKVLGNLALVSVLAMTGCATTGGERDYSQSLYLRGQFA